MIDEKPVLGDLGLPEGRVIAGGEPTRSVLLYRMTTAGRGHMPYLGGKLIDDAGILAVRDWIAGLKREERVPENAARQIAAEETWAKDLADGNEDALTKLLQTSSGALRVALGVIDGSMKGKTRAEAIEKGSALADPLKRDLFERFLPPEKRRKVLGPDFAIETLLSAKGNAAQGKEMFNAICATCHQIDGAGADFGPDLTKVGAKWNRGDLLEQIVHPGKVIDPEWNLTTVATTDDETISGFVAARSDKSVTLKIAGGHRREIPNAEIKSTASARATLMPEGLLDNLSAEEAASLLEFLASHK